MALRRSSRIQQAVSHPISSHDKAPIANVRKVAAASKADANDIERKDKNESNTSKTVDMQNKKTSGKNGAAVDGSLQPQYSKRRRLDGAEVDGEKSIADEGKGWNARKSKARVSKVSPAPTRRVSRGDEITASTESERPTDMGILRTTNIASSNGTITATATSASPAATETVLEKANAFLVRQDPKLADIVERYPCEMFSPTGLQEVVHPFQHLVTGIMAQQVSGAATAAIKLKFVNLFTPPAFPTPAQVASAEISLLRTAGLSGRKAEYVKGLAEKFDSGELTKEMLATASDEEVMSKLTAVRGLGRWSAEMFAFFALKRTDVFATGDLGVQRGMAAYLGRDINKLKAKGGGKWKYLSEKEMLDHSAKFSPYRSLFMWYMWKIQDVNVNALEQKG